MCYEKNVKKTDLRQISEEIIVEDYKNKVVIEIKEKI